MTPSSTVTVPSARGGGRGRPRHHSTGDSVSATIAPSRCRHTQAGARDRCGSRTAAALRPSLRLSLLNLTCSDPLRGSPLSALRPPLGTRGRGPAYKPLSGSRLGAARTRSFTHHAKQTSSHQIKPAYIISHSSFTRYTKGKLLVFAATNIPKIWLNTSGWAFFVSRGDLAGLRP